MIGCFQTNLEKYLYKNQYKDVRIPIAIRKEDEKKIPADAKGRKVLEIPCGSATVEQMRWGGILVTS
ncbi:hypothetical protein BGZ49_009712 [Haplosporangium sp. Z 27]|nr:hypothetical protein BGZ49_009712 [Haplosporangium sp. Z 27]